MNSERPERRHGLGGNGEEIRAAGASARNLRLLLALVVVNAVLLAPGWLLSGTFGPAWISLEAVLVAAVFSLLPRTRWTPWLAAAAALAVVLLATMALGDAVARQALARPLNLYLDVRLLGAVRNLLAGSMGGAAAASILAGSAALAVLLFAALARLLSRSGPAVSKPVPGFAGVLLLVFFAAGAAGERVWRDSRRIEAPGVRVASQQVRHLGRMLDEREAFAVALASAPAGRPPGLLQKLEERDVILAFVESYGISAVEDPRYRPTVLPRLQAMEARLAGAGLHVVTGLLAAPSQGGQSWLGHGSILSGLWLENQLRYDLFLASGRETLIDDFRSAGYRTVAVVPAITMAWPEGERLGYDRIYARNDIGYAGPPLNWVTMPDQFTWSFFERVVRTEDALRPLFAELSLISSHAPWTPILPVLDDWDGIGDGSVFGRWKDAGESPEDLWRDTERVREHYALAVDYALHTITEYAALHVDDRALLIVMGDHQAAPLITGDDAPRSVPVHVIGADPVLLDPFAQWGFVPGAVPSTGADPRGMDRFRDWFLRAYSGSGAYGG